MIEVAFNTNDFFYHGTNDLYAKLILKEIIITKRKSGGVDFGPGFYLTQNPAQAEIFVVERTRKGNWVPNMEILKELDMSLKEFLNVKKSLKPVIIKYRLKNLHYWAQLLQEEKINLFEKSSIRWKNHVWTYRQATEPPKEWLATFGPVADGGINNSTYQDIKAYPEMDQLAIHDAELANDYLEFMEVIPC